MSTVTYQEPHSAHGGFPGSQGVTVTSWRAAQAKILSPSMVLQPLENSVPMFTRPTSKGKQASSISAREASGVHILNPKTLNPGVNILNPKS